MTPLKLILLLTSGAKVKRESLMLLHGGQVSEPALPNSHFQASSSMPQTMVSSTVLPSLDAGPDSLSAEAFKEQGQLSCSQDSRGSSSA